MKVEIAGFGQRGERQMLIEETMPRIQRKVKETIGWWIAGDTIVISLHQYQDSGGVHDRTRDKKTWKEQLCRSVVTSLQH